MAAGCHPRDAEAIRDALESVDFLVASARRPDAPGDVRERVAAMCSLMAFSYDAELAKTAGLTCPVALTPGERERVHGTVRSYFGRRTVPRPTPDPAVSQTLRELANARDAMCACADPPCVERVHGQADAAVKPIPEHLPEATADAVAILDEISRCALRVEAHPGPLP